MAENAAENAAMADGVISTLLDTSPLHTKPLIMPPQLASKRVTQRPQRDGRYSTTPPLLSPRGGEQRSGDGGVGSVTW
jgi:hypothetical protein